MTTACEIPRVQVVAADRLLTSQFVRLLAMVFGSGLSMYLLTSVVPLYLAANGSGGVGAGLSTAAMMFSAVAMELMGAADAGPLGIPGRPRPRARAPRRTVAGTADLRGAAGRARRLHRPRSRPRDPGRRSSRVGRRPDPVHPSRRGARRVRRGCRRTRGDRPPARRLSDQRGRLRR